MAFEGLIMRTLVAMLNTSSLVTTILSSYRSSNTDRPPTMRSGHQIIVLLPIMLSAQSLTDLGKVWLYVKITKVMLYNV